MQKHVSNIFQVIFFISEGFSLSGNFLGCYSLTRSWDNTISRCSNGVNWFYSNIAYTPYIYLYVHIMTRDTMIALLYGTTLPLLYIILKLNLPILGENHIFIYSMQQTPEINRKVKIKKHMQSDTFLFFKSFWGGSLQSMSWAASLGLRIHVLPLSEDFPTRFLILPKIAFASFFCIPPTNIDPSMSWACKTLSETSLHRLRVLMGYSLRAQGVGRWKVSQN